MTEEQKALWLTVYTEAIKTLVASQPELLASHSRAEHCVDCASFLAYAALDAATNVLAGVKPDD